MSDILKIEDLVIQYDTDSGCVHALNGLSLTLREGETLGLVGETGAGKTTLARSIMGLIQCPPGKIVSGKILYRGEDLLTMKEKHRQSHPRQRDLHDLSGSHDQPQPRHDSWRPDCRGCHGA